jgi:NADPH:quinone reductase
MRAVTVNEYGSQPRVSDVPKPKAGPGQVLIKVLAAGMNPMDRSIAMGAWKDVMPAKFPLVLGADVAGVVEEIGTDESRFHRGDKVFGQLLVPPLGSTGTYADYVAVAAEAPLAEIPAALDPTVAAALPTPGVTAYQIAKLLGAVQDKTVLVVGAAGSVGTFLTQLLAQSGARVIAAVRGSDADRVREYGALDTIDYTSQRVADTVRRMQPNGIDALVDVANNAAGFAALAATVRRGGTAITTKYVADVDGLAKAGVTGINFQLKASAEDLESLADAVANERIVAPPISRVPLADAPGAWDQAGSGQSDGKTVLTP